MDFGLFHMVDGVYVGAPLAGAHPRSCGCPSQVLRVPIPGLAGAHLAPDLCLHVPTVDRHIAETPPYRARMSGRTCRTVGCNEQFVRFPLRRIIADVFPNVVQFGFITDNMFPIIALP
jgi:hypothetical protein